MEEEKGGLLHILIIFIGVACLSLGAFMFFTDDHIKLRKERTYASSDGDDLEEENNVISQINLINNVDTKVTLKNGNEITLKYVLNEENNKGSFSYNGKISFETSNIELCDQYYLYNDNVISYCVFGSSSGHLYIIDDSGNSEKIVNFEYDGNSYIPENISIKEDKLFVSGTRITEKTILDIGGKKTYLCDNETLKYNSVSLNSPASASFVLKMSDGKVKFEFNEIIATVNDYLNENCKTVE